MLISSAILRFFSEPSSYDDDGMGSEVNRYYPHYSRGRDKQGRPVIIEYPGKGDAEAMLRYLFDVPVKTRTWICIYICMYVCM